MHLSVVVPVFNEAENIEPLIEEIRSALSGEDYEIVYVDDCSTDNTMDVLLTCQSKFPELRVLRHAHQSGQSTALRSGVMAAKGAWIASLDGDGQNNPADIPKLVARKAELDDPALRMLIGWRQARQDTALRKLSSRVANGVRSRMLRDNTPDTGCGLKLMHRESFNEIPAFNHMHRFLPALFSREGYRVESVAVSHRPRTRGVSKYGVMNRLWVGIIDLIGVAWLQRRPARCATTEAPRP